MEIYALKEIGVSSLKIKIKSEEELENLTLLCKELVNDITFSDWMSRDRGNNVYTAIKLEEKSKILNGTWSIKISPNLYWSIYEDCPTKTVTVNQIKEYIDKYLNAPFYNFNMKLLNKDKKIHNFEDVLIKEPTIKETKQIKQQGKEMKNSPYLRVFSKGKLNVAGLFHQMAKLGNVEEPRQFVLDEIEKEMKRVKEIIKDIKFDEVREKFKANYNIVALSALDALKNLNDSPLFILNDTDKVSMVLAYYKLEKVKNDETSYEWIKPYLTHKVLNNPNKTVLFKSKKREVYIKDGEIFLEDAHDEVVSRVEISYNSETNTFSL